MSAWPRGPISGEAPMQVATRRVLSRKMTERQVMAPAGRFSMLPGAAARVANRMSFMPRFSVLDVGTSLPPPSPIEKSDSVDTIMEIPKTSAQRHSDPAPNFFDVVTKAAGSSWVFVVTMLLLAAWAIYGVIVGPDDTWQILLQNVSSVQVYVSDILLLRQQSNSLKSLVRTLAEMQSRNQTVDRLLHRIPDCEWMETHDGREAKPILSPTTGRPIEEEAEETLMLELQNTSRARYIWNQVCRVTANALGSVWSFMIYWTMIIVWAALGPAAQFSDTWQLDINTITAIILTFTSVFLQNIQQQQEDLLEKSLEYATKVDAEVEKHLRELADDQKPNPIFDVQPPKMTRIERAIDFFADTMGSMWGVGITVLFFIIWGAIGPTLEFGDFWFLILGTFTGLVGFIDGFVLRNAYSREAVTVNAEFAAIEASDERLFDLLNLPYPALPPLKPENFSTRVSRAAGDFCGLAATSVGSVLVVIGLLAIATAMKWTETAQLLCNTPTMIIEGFLLLVLIQAHNLANGERARSFKGILRRRLVLNSFVLGLSEDDIGVVVN